jgi:hypothetical protein
MNHLGITYRGVDQGDAVPNMDYTGVIIATPTATHVDLIEFYAHLNLPILCEKPIATEESGLVRALNVNAKLMMVDQYSQIVGSDTYGDTYYNYWNSGADGPGWDCINIIGKAEGSVALVSHKSPIWLCMINGQALNIKDMDVAYCTMIEGWAKRPRENLEYIDKAHRRVLRGEYEYDR